MLLYTATLLDMTFSIVYGLRIILLWTSNPVSFAPQKPPLPYTGSSCIYSNVTGLKPVVRKHNTWNGYICWQIKWQIKWQIMTWRRTCICMYSIFHVWKTEATRTHPWTELSGHKKWVWERDIFCVSTYTVCVCTFEWVFPPETPDLKLVISHIRPDHSIL